jgi:hypothetical protein
LIESTTQYNKISEIVGDSVRDNDFLTALESFIDVYKEERYKKESLTIPLSPFANRKLGVLETAVKILKENRLLNYSQTAKLLNRNDRTVWAAYHKAAKKQKEKFVLKKEEYNIPCDIFSERKQGPLEALVVYLKDELKLSFKQISGLLNRNYRTIWLSYKNGLRKRENKGMVNAQ